MNVQTTNKRYSSLYRHHPYERDTWSHNKRIRRTKKGKESDEDPNISRKERRMLEDFDHLYEDVDDALHYGVSDVYSKDNHIYYKSPVNKKSIEELIDLIDEKNEEYSELRKHKLIKSLTPYPIYLHISSYGGDLLMGFKAVDAIQRSKVPIHTIVDGPVASAASLMAVVGQKRYMTPNSFHLIHQLSSGMWGKFAELKDDFENCTSFMNKIVQIYTDHTNMTEKQIRDQLEHDSWWDIEKCLETEAAEETWKGK